MQGKCLVALLTALMPGLAAAQQYPSINAQDVHARGTLTVDGAVAGSAFAGSANLAGAGVVYANDPTFAGGMKCDGSTNDTAALQAAELAAEGSARTLLLPSGTCNISGVTIAGSVVWVGAGKLGTILNLVSGSTVPAVTVSIQGPLPGGNYQHVTLSRLQIRSPNKLDAPGQTVAHGVAVTQPVSNAARVALLLIEVEILNVPADSLYTQPSWTGYIETLNCDFWYPGRYNLNFNSVTDFNIHGGSISGATLDNVLLSGTNNIRFNGVNVFVAAQKNFNVFNSYAVIVNSDIANSGRENIQVNNQNGRRVDIIGTQLGWSSSSANATYSDLSLTAGNTGEVHLTNNHFLTPASTLNANKAQYNINCIGGNTGALTLTETSFDLGPPSTAGVTNNLSCLWTFSDTATLVSGIQRHGYVVNNGSNIVASLLGSDGSNDGGTLHLANGGTDQTVIKAVGVSQIAGPLADQAEAMKTSGTASGVIANTVSRVILDGVTSPYTITMPAGPVDGQPLRVQCGTAVASLTMTPSAGQTMKGGSATSCTVTQGHQWHYNLSNTSWYMDY